MTMPPLAHLNEHQPLPYITIVRKMWFIFLSSDRFWNLVAPDPGASESVLALT